MQMVYNYLLILEVQVLIGNEYINFRDSIREVTNRNELTITSQYGNTGFL